MRPDTGRNTLIITGSGSDRAAAIDTILSFDADWMNGQSVGIFPVRNSTPEPLITELEKIMDSGEGGLSQNVVKFQPIGRLNAILVVSQKPEYLKRAGTWIARLDKSDTDAVNLKSYPLRYGNSKLIVGMLNEMLFGQRGGGSLDSASSQISPGSGVSLSSSSSSSNPVAALSALPTAASGALDTGKRGSRSRIGGSPLTCSAPLSRPRAQQLPLPRTIRPAACSAPGPAGASRPAAPFCRMSGSPPTSPTTPCWSMPIRNRNASSSRPSARSTGRSARSRSRRRSPK